MGKRRRQVGVLARIQPTATVTRNMSTKDMPSTNTTTTAKYRAAVAVLFCLAAVPVVPDAAVAQTDSEELPEYSAKEVRQSLLLQAKDYVITSGKTKLKMAEDSLLNWSNPSRTTEQGVLMVWSDDGMPMAMATLFTYAWQGVKLKHELISLSENPLQATYLSQTAWTPKRGGIKWEKFVPSKSNKSLAKVSSLKSRRLAQMRSIAREFDVEMVNNYEGNRKSKLRLMSEPVHRFASKKHGTVDGAVFAYCISTDPETLLLVRATEDGEWQCAFAPSNECQMSVSRSSKRVWHMDFINGMRGNYIGTQPQMTFPYMSFHVTNDQLFRPHPDFEASETE